MSSVDAVCNHCGKLCGEEVRSSSIVQVDPLIVSYEERKHYCKICHDKYIQPIELRTTLLRCFKLMESMMQEQCTCTNESL